MTPFAALGQLEKNANQYLVDAASPYTPQTGYALMKSAHPGATPAPPARFGGQLKKDIRNPAAPQGQPGTLPAQQADGGEGWTTGDTAELAADVALGWNPITGVPWFGGKAIKDFSQGNWGSGLMNVGFGALSFLPGGGSGAAALKATAAAAKASAAAAKGSAAALKASGASAKAVAKANAAAAKSSAAAAKASAKAAKGPGLYGRTAERLRFGPRATSLTRGQRVAVGLGGGTTALAGIGADATGVGQRSSDNYLGPGGGVTQQPQPQLGPGGGVTQQPQPQPQQQLYGGGGLTDYMARAMIHNGVPPDLTPPMGGDGATPQPQQPYYSGHDRQEEVSNFLLPRYDQ